MRFAMKEPFKSLWRRADRIRDLMKFGVKFDKTKSTNLSFLGGAHSRRRVLHVADKTGFSIENVF